MANLNIQRISDGARLTITGNNGVSGGSIDLYRNEVEQTVRALCAAAGLPEPWKKG